eukprot:TRINITY_DN59358_c0_g1_i1.p1 TRINITY_DN59358_c0_g1~~TRINITY_DN59358_c0_g1_i1.p1  ORF type:complete len:465 (+),score=103.78 TRINITY_DN59358_c0_g1_i1:253-1647(+)
MHGDVVGSSGASFQETWGLRNKLGARPDARRSDSGRGKQAPLRKPLILEQLRAGRRGRHRDLLCKLSSEKLLVDARDFTLVIFTLGRLEQWRLACSALAHLSEDAGLQPNDILVNAAMSALEQSQQWRAAVRLVQQLQVCRLRSDDITINTAIGTCREDRQWHRGITLMQHMVCSGLLVDAISFNAAIAACERGGSREGRAAWHHGLALLLGMLAVSVLPDVISLNAATSGCEKGEQWATAGWMLSRWSSRNSVEPDVITHSAAVSACAAAICWAPAICTLAGMASSGVLPGDVACNAGISACCAGSGGAFQWRWSVRSLHTMDALKLTRDIISYNSAMSAVAKAGAWTKALGLLAEMRRDVVAADDVTYSSALKACQLAAATRSAARTNGGAAVTSKGLLDEMRSLRLREDCVAYSDAMSASWLAGQSGVVLELVDDMCSTAMMYMTTVLRPSVRRPTQHTWR